MKIALLADIHGNFHNLVRTLQEVKKHKVTHILFLGDFVNAGIAKILARSKVPVHAIWGNNEGDKAAIVKASLRKGSALSVSANDYGEIELGGRRLFMTHYPQLAKALAKSGMYDAVFFGHTHHVHQEKVGNCLVLNPGEISAHKTGVCTYAIYDTKTNTAKVFTVQDSVSVYTEAVRKYIKKIGYAFNKTATHQV